MKKSVLWFFSLLITLSSLCARAEYSDRVIQVVEKSMSAVVFIAGETNYFDLNYGPNPSSSEFLRPLYDWLYPPVHFHGSGFFISPDGYIVTNAHVTEDATSFLICTQGLEKRILKATLVGSDMRSDIAVLKVDNDENTPFPYLPLGNSHNVKVGESVLLIGSPQDPVLEGTVTVGAISGKERNGFDLCEIQGFLQTDSAANPGNSGGPLIDLNGEVVGVLQFGFSQSLGLEGLSFAIPSYTAKHISQQLIKHGKVTQASLGVALESGYTEAFHYFYFPENAGAIVHTVFDDSPAKQGGLEEGDVIVEMNSYPIASPESLRNHIWVLPPNTPVHFTLKRNGEILKKNVILRKDLLPKYDNNHMVL